MFRCSLLATAFLASMAAGAASAAPAANGAAVADLETMYWQGRFEAAATCVADDGATLERSARLLWVDAVARGGAPFRAWRLLAPELASAGGDSGAMRPDADLLATAAAVHLALGRPHRSAEFVAALLDRHPEHPRGCVAAACLALFQRDCAAAAAHVKNLQANELAKDTPLAGQLERETARACGDSETLGAAWERAEIKATARGDSVGADRWRANRAMLAALGAGPLYRLDAADDLVEVPLHDRTPGVPYKCFTLELAGESFDVLLDTGNAVGWTIHEPRLLELLSCTRGRSTQILTGSVAEELPSHELATPYLPLGPGAAVHDLVGYFFAKPHPDYHDANLNPYLLRGRVVTLDFVRDRLILRSPERFARDLAAVSPAHLARVPVGGHEWPFVPVTVNGVTDALAMIETGAEDLSLRLEFARQAGISLTPAVMTWRDESLDYHTAPITLQFGPLALHRAAAPVWPVRFHANLSGLADHVMLGPAALEDRFVLSFDAEVREAVIERVYP
ncbi:MAG: hypothetical protein R6X25_15985 [Candidatus Krumholzibacteriia bacterium]